MTDKLQVIVVGTDPSSQSGGIGFALPGYLRALNCTNTDFVSIPTYHPSAPNGKWLYWLRAFPRLWHQIIDSRKNNTRVIIYSHAGAGVSLLREMFVLAFCKLLGGVTIIQLHALEIDGYLAHPIKRWLFRLATSPASAMAVLTPWWKARMIAGEIRKPMFVIPNPLPAAWEQTASTPCCTHNENKKAVTLLSLTRIVPGKGVDLVVEAMPHLPEDVELVIAGEGSQLACLKQRAKSLGIEHRVRFTGWVAGEEKQKLFDEADIYCLPSAYDSFGMGFLEAMANGLPVIALNWGAISDVVPDGRCGLLIRERSSTALADAINRLCDSNLRRTMGINAKQWVLEKFAAKKVGEDIRLMMEAISGMSK